MSVVRQTEYSAQLAEQILERLAAGESLRSICKAAGMPGESTVRGWATSNLEGFGVRYAQAREHQAHALLDEIIDTAREEKDAGIGRMRVDALKWAAARILPKVYSDRVDLNHNATLSLEDLVLQSMAPAKVGITSQRALGASSPRPSTSLVEPEKIEE